MRFPLNLKEAFNLGGHVAFTRSTGANEQSRRLIREWDAEVNVPEGDMVQYSTALGAAILGHQRLQKLQEAGEEFPQMLKTAAA